MSFQIVEIVETQPEKIQAVVKHGTHQMSVTIAGQSAGDIMAGESFPAEIGYDQILDWKVIDDFEDARSGIWQGQDGIHLLGRVHNILDYGDGKIIMDVYIQNGPEFFTLSSEAIADAAFESNDGLEIIVGNLYIYPAEN
jgi:hypothetical protein